MTRTLLKTLALLTLVPGCGESEGPRFTPAGPGTQTSTPIEAGKASREATIPRNIETH